jgi:G3E family GTPase
MKLLQIAGYLGSGKTTLIIELGRALSEQGSKVAILVNEIGEIPVDGRVMEDYGLTVKDIGGGCICCQVVGNMIGTLRKLSEVHKPDIVIIEPTGMAVPSSISDAVKRIDIDEGPTIVLFDTSRQEKLLNYDTLKRLISTQLKDADIIALSKVELISGDMIERARQSVSLINPKARIIDLSTKRGDGLLEIVKAIQEMKIKT